ncbi:hypothetical protein CAPTEDRAFT_220198 [Capitella teleta]|uniref:Complex I assembly factor TIMMDC1, mitochondrial n=1 Tax=Capitella teleta TaxID=283909 RepID=R7V1G2_CAPTE|nr:hypothetical protein CAPTEDRAFT_220198 [Capitella teleta]|eukprot:ELU12337.1 hypothetical protein CAPTEDRAFT_220198 [Capitella teleta]
MRFPEPTIPWNLHRLRNSLFRSQRNPRLLQTSGLFSHFVLHAEEPIMATMDMTTLDKLATAKPQITISDEEIRAYIAKETPEERVKALFSRMDDGSLHPVIDDALMKAQGASFIGFVAGCVSTAQHSKQRFEERNRHTKFETRFIASRAYHDSLFVECARLGVNWALRTVLFVSIFLLSSHTVAAYKNKTSWYDYAVGGAVTGSLLKVNFGLKGMFAAGLVGSMMGGVSGFLFYGAKMAAGDLQEQMHDRFIMKKLLDKKEVEMIGKGEDFS